MSEDLSFKFYSVLKNEDADPFMEDGLLVVTDGLGGAGSVVHELDKIKYERKEFWLEDFLIHCAIGVKKDQIPEWLMDYINIWFKPMIDSEPDTSALWASRIAIARFVYAVRVKMEWIHNLSDINIRKNISEFIVRGLNDVVKKFNLQPGKYENQKLLPTTLAALIYADDNKKKTVDVDALWAGDSRCYLLNKDGLKQLTIDDEDNAEMITNLFYAGGRPTTLNHKKYSFLHPCILITVSDGVFDPYSPYDNLGVEAILLENIKKCNSSKELCEKLKLHYDAVRADDATMAFVPLGFDSYAHIQKVLAARTVKVLDIWEKYHKYKSKLDIVDSQEAADDVIGKISSRTSDKIDKILQTIADLHINKEKDIVLSGQINSIIISIIENTKKEFESNKDLRKKEALLKLKEYILLNYQDLEKSILTIDEIDFSKAKEFGQAYNNLKKAASGLMQIQNTFDELLLQEQALSAECENSIQQVIKYRDEIHKKSSNLDNDVTTLKDLQNQYNGFGKILEFYKEKKPKCSSLFSKSSMPESAVIIDKLIDKKNQLEKRKAEIKKELEVKTNQYKKTVNDFFDSEKYKVFIIEENEENIKQIFQQKIIDDFGLLNNKKQVMEKVSVEKLSKELLNEFRRNPKNIELIVSALADNFNETSAIDINYNETRLNAFREYYRLQATSSKDVVQFKKELELFIEQYESLLKGDKKL